MCCTVCRACKEASRARGESERVCQGSGDEHSVLMAGILCLSKIKGTGGGRKVRGIDGEFVCSVNSQDFEFNVSAWGCNFSGSYALFKD